MKALEVKEIFRLHFDRYQSDEGITDYEISRAINDATLMVMKNHFRPQLDRNVNSIYKDPRMGFEATTYNSEDWRTLLCEDIIKADSKGILSYSQIKSKFPKDIVYCEDGSTIDTDQVELFHILSVGRWNGSSYVEAKFTRHNEIRHIEQNSFTKAVNDCPRYYYLKEGIQMLPGGGNNVKITVARHPIQMWCLQDVGILVDPELPRSIMMDIIIMAVKIAAMGTKDQSTYQFAKAQTQDL